MHYEKDYHALQPDVVLEAVESTGVITSGRMLALNSYENRVYRVELENGDRVVAKFYRPGRWSNDTIAEEHAFALELAGHEVPVVAPLLHDDASLHEHAGYRFAVYPLQGGRWPELEQRDDLVQMGRFIGRIHMIGRQRPFLHRPEITIERMGVEPVDYLCRHDFIPAYLLDAYRSLAADLLRQIEAGFTAAGRFDYIRLHGDCHRGNVLWTDAGPHFVDLDDCCNGPAIQDLWMLLAGDRNEVTIQMCDLLEGYEDFAALDLAQLQLIEPLRTLRMMHYAAWLARRWEDPAFKLAFPWFNTTQYWEEHVLELREQLANMREPVLQV